MSTLRKAGLILYYIDGEDVYFRCMIPSDPAFGGSNPQIPKGTIEPGDTPKYTAVKECIEEVGLDINNLSSIKEFKRYSNMKMMIYIGTVTNINRFNKPHWESKWSGWVSYNNSRNKLRNLQQHIFDDIYSYLVKK